MTTSYALSANHPFPLPAGLRDDARGISPGPIRLGSLEFVAHGAGRYRFDAIFALGDTIHRASLTAFGPADAMTSMLYDAGYSIEILEFHQHPTDAGTVTFALCSGGGRTAWAMGTGSTPFESTARALVSGANRLH